MIVNRREIETRFALHPFLERWRDAFEKIGKGVHGHQVKTHIIFLDRHRAEKYFLFEFFRITRVEIIIARRVGFHGQVLFVLMQNAFETREGRLEPFFALQQFAPR